VTCATTTPASRATEQFDDLIRVRDERGVVVPNEAMASRGRRTVDRPGHRTDGATKLGRVTGGVQRSGAPSVI
jgi:hypothetical protein